MRIRVEQAPPSAPERRMTRVAVVFPAYNEERHVAEAVGAALAVGAGHVVCVDDSSTDATARIVDGLAADPRVHALHHQVNCGKQAAVRRGLELGAGLPGVEAVAVLDADMQNDPALLPQLCGHVGRCDLVIGRRAQAQMPAARRLANALANAPYRFLAGIPVCDVQSGYRVYSREAAAWLAERLDEAGRYTLEHTSLLALGELAAARGRDVRVAEVLIPCPYGEARSAIRLRDNLQLTWAALYHAAMLARLRK